MHDTPISQLLAERNRFLNFVKRRVSDSAWAEDILQGAYLRALEHQDDFAPGQSLVTWFYSLLRNAVIDSYRRQSTKAKALEEWKRELEMSNEPSPDVRNEVCACLNAMLEGLKPEYSEVLRAVDLGDQRVQDFAQQQGLSGSNAGVRLHRGRAALRKRLMRACGVCAEHGCLNCTCKKHTPY